MERLSPLDAAFVEAEDQDRHISMAIGSVAVFEGPRPSYDEFVSVIERRLPLVPRYRQTLRQVPLRLGPPVWVDDPRFDVRFHIRQTALPDPGGDADLQRLMARVMGQRLDRDRPLWEDWLVTGLAGERWALISKVHHCMVDGISGTDLYRVMFDTVPNAAIPPLEPPRPAPTTDARAPLPPVAISATRRPTRPGRSRGRVGGKGSAAALRPSHGIDTVARRMSSSSPASSRRSPNTSRAWATASKACRRRNTSSTVPSTRRCSPVRAAGPRGVGPRRLGPDGDLRPFRPAGADERVREDLGPSLHGTSGEER